MNRRNFLLGSGEAASATPRSSTDTSGGVRTHMKIIVFAGISAIEQAL